MRVMLEKIRMLTCLHLQEDECFLDFSCSGLLVVRFVFDRELLFR